MNRRAFLAGAAGLAACGERRPRLNVFNWSAYVAPDTIPNFEREFGVQVRYAVYDSNEEMLARSRAKPEMGFGEQLSVVHRARGHSRLPAFEVW